MGELLPYLVVTVVLATVIGLFAWLAVVVRRRGLAGAALRGALAAHDEAFHVTAHDSAYEVRVQAERKVPVVTPGGGGRRMSAPRPRPRPPRRRLRFRKGGPRPR